MSGKGSTHPGLLVKSVSKFPTLTSAQAGPAETWSQSGTPRNHLFLCPRSLSPWHAHVFEVWSLPPSGKLCHPHVPLLSTGAFQASWALHLALPHAFHSTSGETEAQVWSSPPSSLPSLYACYWASLPVQIGKGSSKNSLGAGGKPHGLPGALWSLGIVRAEQRFLPPLGSRPSP